MADCIAREDLDFGMALLARYRHALEVAEFVHVPARLEDAGGDAVFVVLDEAALNNQVSIWRDDHRAGLG